MYGTLHPPLVSVGIPTYDQTSGLNRLRHSIINQTYTNVEIIISNDCSHVDEIEATIHSFMNSTSCIKYFKQPKSLGAPANHNFVLQQATGEFFMWANDDDYYEAFYLYCLSCLHRITYYS